MSGCINLEVHYPLAFMGSDVIPSAKHTCSFWCLQPHHVTWGLHLSSVDALADIHSRSHNFLLIHPREVLLAGCWVTTLPLLSCGISCGGGLAWGGVGTPVPCMMDAYIQGNATSDTTRSQFHGGCMTFCVGPSLQYDTSPPMYLLPTYPWSSSFP